MYWKKRSLEESMKRGKFELSTKNNFLLNKFSWVPGTSDFAQLVAKNIELKADTGGCPMLRKNHRRVDDLPGGADVHGNAIFFAFKEIKRVLV